MVLIEALDVAYEMQQHVRHRDVLVPAVRLRDRRRRDGLGDFRHGTPLEIVQAVGDDLFREGLDDLAG